MSFALNADVRIHYEVEGSGPPLVLQHGFTDTLEAWHEHGYVDDLAGTYQLILLDARGHGLSDKPHDPAAYTLEQLASDVTTVLDAEGVEKTHFYGYSMGGRIAYGMAKHAPERLLSLMVGGIPPYGNIERSTQFVALLEQGVAGFIAAFEAVSPLSPGLKARMEACDIDALIAMQGCRLLKDDDVVGALGALTCPYWLIAGDADLLAPYSEIVEYAKTLPGTPLITLPGLDHFQGLERSDMVLPHLHDFFDKVSSA